MPSKNLSANKIIMAFITNKNKPSVIMVIGKVRTTNIGFINVLSNARTNANIRASLKSGICTPDSNADKPYATSALINRRIIKFIMNNYIVLQTIDDLLKVTYNIFFRSFISINYQLIKLFWLQIFIGQLHEFFSIGFFYGFY